ncbi:hypothetical protein HLK66_03895 [Niallia circulans]|uniref:hypothetical protein n=3 Tax=Niallia circulans TaxID=1397 RepID=UPI00148F74C1|nr:hypothetical protein [Niallia circulans]QJX60881.1 hypothetical protein HLK66_03895 [Niallia circulans]
MIDLLNLTLNKELLNWNGNVTKSISLSSDIKELDDYKESIQKKIGFSPKDYLYKTIDALDTEAAEEVDNIKIKEYDLDYIKKNNSIDIKDIPFFYGESTDYTILIIRSDLYKYSIRYSTISKFKWNSKIDTVNIGNYDLIVSNPDNINYKLELELLIKKGELVFGEIWAYSIGIMEGTFYVTNPNSIEQILLINNQVSELANIIFKRP